MTNAKPERIVDTSYDEAVESALALLRADNPDAVVETPIANVIEFPIGSVNPGPEPGQAIIDQWGVGRPERTWWRTECAKNIGAGALCLAMVGAVLWADVYAGHRSGGGDSEPNKDTPAQVELQD